MNDASGFDPAEFSQFHQAVASSAPAPGKFDPNEFAAFTAHPNASGPAAGSPVADSYWRGLTTNDPTKGLPAMAGRETMRMGGAMLAAPAAAALGITGAGMPAAMAIEGSGAGAGEVLRQGVVKAAGNPTDFSSVPGTAGAYALGKPLGVAAKWVARGAGELGAFGMEKLAGAGRGIPAASMEFAEKNPIQALRGMSENLPGVAKNIGTIVADFADQSGKAYEAAKQALIEKFGPQQVVPRQGLAKEMQAIVESSPFNSKSEVDRPVLREVGRLIKDATKPFSGSIEGAIEMEQRFNRAIELSKSKSVEASGSAYEKLIGDLKGAVSKRIDTLDPEGNFGQVRKGYYDSQQLIRDAGNYLNAKNMPRMTETAMNTGNTDADLIHRIQTVVPDTIDAFNKMQRGIHGQYFKGSTINQAALGAGAINRGVVQPALERAPGVGISQWAEKARSKKH